MSDFDYRQAKLDSELKSIDEQFDTLRRFVHAAYKDKAFAWRAYDSLREEKWHDEQLQKMKEERDKATKERNLGFPLTQEEVDKTCEWQRRHDAEAHSNHKRYHGASGGGYSWTFYPTGLGTTCTCYCDVCKSQAIREAGAGWRNRCDELGGSFQVIGWEAF